MVTAIHIIKFIVKLALFIIFLPFIILWLLYRYLCYRTILVHNLIQSGMPREYALELAKETRIRQMLKTSPN